MSFDQHEDGYNSYRCSTSWCASVRTVWVGGNGWKPKEREEGSGA